MSEHPVVNGRALWFAQSLASTFLLFDPSRTRFPAHDFLFVPFVWNDRPICCFLDGARPLQRALVLFSLSNCDDMPRRRIGGCSPRTTPDPRPVDESF